MSALDESSDGPIEVIQVLIALHPSFGAQELCGPLEVLSNAFHKLRDPGTWSRVLPSNSLYSWASEPDYILPR